MASPKNTPVSAGKLSDRFKNITDTNLLLLITIVVFFAMYIGAIVFQGKGFWLKEYCKCCTTWFFSYLLNACLLEIFVKILNFNVYLSQILATLCCAIFNYLLFKRFAFKV